MGGHRTKRDENFDVEALQSGTYILEATVEISGEIVTTSTEIQVNSAFNTLKGTVITAEDTSGQALQSGTVTLYESVSYSGHSYFEPLKNVPIKLNNGVYEAFIPDTYILDGKEYIMTITDEIEKIVYVKHFEGQAKKNYHFKAEGLKDVKIDVGNLKTLKLEYSLSKPEGSSHYFPLSMSGTGWKMDTDYSIVLNWVGTDANQTGYSWSGDIDIGKGEEANIANASWKTFKPLSSYPKAKIGLYQFNELFKELNIGSEREYFGEPLKLVVEDNDTIYSSGVYGFGGQSDMEVAFTPYRGDAYSKYAKEIVIRYFNQYGLELKVENTGGVKPHSYTYEIYNEANHLVGTSTTYDLNLLKLEEPLPKGKYTIKLADTTVNKEIINLKMESVIMVGEDINSNAKEITHLPLQHQTKYGDFPKKRSSITLSKKTTDDRYNPRVDFYWNPEIDRLEAYRPYLIEPLQEYDLQIMLYNSMSNVTVIDEKTMTGQQLLNLNTENPLLISEELHQLTVHPIEGPVSQRNELNLQSVTNGQNINIYLDVEADEKCIYRIKHLTVH